MTHTAHLTPRQAEQIRDLAERKGITAEEMLQCIVQAYLEIAVDKQAVNC